MITIHRIPESLVNLKRGTAEYNEAVAALKETDNEVYRLLLMFPEAADDGGNYAFASTLPDAANPIFISEFADENGNKLAGMSLIQATGKEMIKSDRSRAIHCTKSDVAMLTESSVWKLWAKLIDDKNELEAAHEEVFNEGVDRKKSIESLKREAAKKIKSSLEAKNHLV